MEIDKMALAVQAASIVCSVVDGVLGLQSAIGVDGLSMLGDLRAFKLRSGKMPVVPNPLFGAHGHTGGKSPATQAYLNSRHFKNVAGGAADIAGIIGGGHLGGVNVSGAVMHGQSTILTSMHMGGLTALAARYRQTQTISEWLKFIGAMKAAKFTIRSAQTIGSAVPLAAMPTGIIAAVVKAGVSLTTNSACLAVASQIHWRAFQEQAISRGGAKIGPASMIMDEIFRKRGATRLLGSYDVMAFMHEPAGWLALGDKLALM